MDDPIPEFPREKLCPCVMCKVAYDILDFMEMLVDERMQAKVADDLEIPPEHRSAEKMRTALLCSAVAEYGFRYGAPPEDLLSWIIIAWNKRARLAVMGALGPSAIDKKLEDYES